MHRQELVIPGVHSGLGITLEECVVGVKIDREIVNPKIELNCSSTLTVERKMSIVLRDSQQSRVLDAIPGTGPVAKRIPSSSSTSSDAKPTSNASDVPSLEQAVNALAVGIGAETGDGNGGRQERATTIRTRRIQLGRSDEGITKHEVPVDLIAALFPARTINTEMSEVRATGAYTHQQAPSRVQLTIKPNTDHNAAI